MDNNLYFESLKNIYRSDYLVDRPKKSEVLRNAKKPGRAVILGGTNNRAILIYSGDDVYLQSYDTLILQYNPKTGALKKLWNDYSVTTLKHINAFMTVINKPGFNKKGWLDFREVTA